MGFSRPSFCAQRHVNETRFLRDELFGGGDVGLGAFRVGRLVVSQVLSLGGDGGGFVGMGWWVRDE